MKEKQDFKEYYEEDIENSHGPLKLIALIGNVCDERALSLFYSSKSNIFLEKGPFARWDMICFRVSRVENFEDVKVWLTHNTEDWAR